MRRGYFKITLVLTVTFMFISIFRYNIKKYISNRVSDPVKFSSDIVTDKVAPRNGSVKLQSVIPFKSKKASRIVFSRTLTHKTNILVQTALYRYPFEYQNPYLLLNDGVCEVSENVSIIFLIHSAPRHFDQRQAIRSTWANNTYYLDLGVIKHLFLLGRVDESAVKDRINEEFLKFGDLLQGDFIDHYHNLSLNTLTGMRWVKEHCNNAKFVVKVDDDVFVHILRLLQNVVPKIESSSKQVYCNVLTKSLILRDIKSKWYVEPSILPGQQFYPKYCEGKFVMLSKDIVPLLYSTAASVPLFWIEDVYVYGMVLNEIPDITFSCYTGRGEFRYIWNETGVCLKKSDCLFASAGAKAMLTTWSTLKNLKTPLG